MSDFLANHLNLFRLSQRVSGLNDYRSGHRLKPQQVTILSASQIGVCITFGFLYFTHFSVMTLLSTNLARSIACSLHHVI